MFLYVYFSVSDVCVLTFSRLDHHQRCPSKSHRSYLLLLKATVSLLSLARASLTAPLRCRQKNRLPNNTKKLPKTQRHRRTPLAVSHSDLTPLVRRNPPCLRFRAPGPLLDEPSQSRTGGTDRSCRANKTDGHPGCESA